MALKNYKIHYKRHCAFDTFDHVEYIKAVSEKMAIKKFWKFTDNGMRTQSNHERMEYERDALGYQWTDVRAELIPA